MCCLMAGMSTWLSWNMWILGFIAHMFRPRLVASLDKAEYRVQNSKQACFARDALKVGADMTM